jgi:PST family polysaccharide transporter
MTDIRQKAIRGGFAKICSQALAFLVRLVALMVLARLLDPKDFGLVGMVTAVIGVLYLFRDFGLSTAAVQRATVTPEQMSTLFWINLLVGALLVVICVIAAPFIASFYREPRLVQVTIAVGTGFLFTAAGVQHSAVLQREMRFGALAISETVSQVVSSGIAILMALRGYGYWALVVMTATAPLIFTLCTWVAARWMPGPPRTQLGMKSMMRFGGTVTLNGIIVYVSYNMEKVLMGRFWGAETVGIYGRAYQLITLPNDNLNSALSGVAFSALSRLQDQPSTLRNYFLKSYSLVLAVTVPVTVFCAVFATDLLLVMLGPKWHESAAIFRCLAPMVLVLSCINPMYWLLVSLGLIERSLKMALVIAPLVITSYLIGFKLGGPRAVALSYSAAMTLWALPHLAWSVYGTPISFRDILVTIGRPLLSGLVAGALAFGVQQSYGSMMSPLLRLIAGGSVLLFVYAGMLLYGMGQKDLYFDLLRTFRGGRSVPGKQPLVSATLVP